MRWTAPALLSSLLGLAGCNTLPTFEAGVGSDNEGCGLDGTHSVVIGQHSCACEPGYTWCSDDPSAFECCPETGMGTETGDEPIPPEQSCDEDEAETLVCIPDPDAPSNPGGAVVWACNGERWVEVPGYADFACEAKGLPFAYGCVPGPEFLCGFGPGSPCDITEYEGICIDEDIIDTCVWGRRTVDRCTRLCTELELFGPGYTGGACVAITDQPAVCICTG